MSGISNINTLFENHGILKLQKDLEEERKQSWPIETGPIQIVPPEDPREKETELPPRNILHVLYKRSLGGKIPIDNVRKFVEQRNSNENFWPYEQLAFSYNKTGEYEKAEVIALKALFAQPTEPDLTLLLLKHIEISLEGQMNKTKKEEERAQKYLDTHPQNPEILSELNTHLRKSQVKQRWVEQALHDVPRAQSHNRDQLKNALGILSIHLAASLIENWRLIETIELATFVIRQMPPDSEITKLLKAKVALALMKQRKYLEAEALLRECLLSPAAVARNFLIEIKLNLATCLKENENYEEAKSVVQGALFNISTFENVQGIQQIDDNLKEALVKLSLVLRQLG